MTHPAARYLRRVARAVAARPEPVGRGVATRADDVFLTSYPKSGNTWTRFLVANLVWPDRSTDFTNVEGRIPDLYKATADELAGMPGPRYLKSHEYFDPRYPKVVYVVRDVRSVFLSYYFHKVRRGELDPETAHEAFARTFIAGRADPYGTWAENVLSWTALRGRDAERFLLLRYEDLLSSGATEVRRLADFLGLERNDLEIDRTVEASSFERMKELERAAGTAWAGNRKNRGGAFMRSGKADEWATALPPEVDQLLLDANGDVMRQLGYL